MLGESIWYDTLSILYLHKCGSMNQEKSGSNLSAFLPFVSKEKDKNIRVQRKKKINKKTYVESICVSVTCFVQPAALESGVSFFL